MNQFFPFEDSPQIAVAVSGGPDSLALCLLLNKWVTQKQGHLTALTFDHRLRGDSTVEAREVNKWLTKKDITHHILSWEGQKPVTDIQNKARLARYHALEEWCHDHHIMHLFLGHHAQDQEETILQRLLHGSGPKGLQGIGACTFRPFGRLLRPLLHFSKQDLTDFLKASEQPFFSDPSNFKQDFERVKIRNLLPSLHALAATPLPFSQVALKCQSFTQVIEEDATDFFLKACSLHPLGFLQLQRTAFLTLSSSLQSLILSHALQAIGGGIYPFSHKTVQNVIAKIQQQQNTTLGGCLVVQKAKEIWIIREERAIAASTLIEGPTVYWDNRFFIQVPCAFIGSTLVPGAYAFPNLKQRLAKDLPFLHIPSYVLKTLPFLRKTERDFISVLHSKEKITAQLRLRHRLTSS